MIRCRHGRCFRYRAANSYFARMMIHEPAQTSPIDDYLKEIHHRHAELKEGQVATYIPELAKANPDWFGICLATTGGHVYEVGDSRQSFTIQSISKPFVYGLALEDNTRAEVLKKLEWNPREMRSTPSASSPERVGPETR